MSIESNEILVAYATRYSSSREVAEAIAATLHEQGLEVAIKPVQKVAGLNGYSAIVVGAPLRKALAGFPWLAPLSSEVFCGRYDPARLRFGDRLIAKLPISPLQDAPASDARDWAAIRAWAGEPAGRLP